MGLSSLKAKYNEKGSTLMTKSLFGERYIISKENLNEFQYDKYDHSAGLSIYRYKYALPLGFPLTKEIKEIKTGNNAFDNLNRIANSIYGDELNIYKELHPKMIGYKNAKYDHKTETYTRIDEKKPILIQYELDMENEEKVHYYFDNDIYWTTKVTINGKEVKSELEFPELGVHETSLIKKGTNTITFSFNSSEAKKKELFYVEDRKDFEKLYKKINNQTFKVISLEGNTLTAKGNIEEDGQDLFMSIPYYDTWKVKMNGKEVKPTRTFGGFMMIPATKGIYELNLSYYPKGFKTGSLISLVSIICSIYLWRRKKTV